MDRSRPNTLRLLVTALAFSLVGLAVACDSGTQEPDAPKPSTEFGAAPSAGSTPKPAPTAAAQPPRDGSIAPERFPTELPDGITAEIPDNFPSSIPIYPGAQAAQGKGAEVNGSPVSGVQLLSNDSPGEIFAFYEEQLKANGWDITESQNDQMSSSITATKGGCKAALFIQASPQGGSDIFVINEC
jgi:hypothetical protein